MFGSTQPSHIAFELTKITTKARELSECADDVFGARVSGGELTRLNLARRLIKFINEDASILIFDEPEQGIGADLACEIIKNVINYCKKHNKAFIFASHLENVAKRIKGITHHIHVENKSS